MSFSFRTIQPSNFVSVVATTQFQAEIASAINSEVDFILVDLKQIESVSSGTFLALLEGLKVAHASQCKLLICSLGEQLRILFELTGLDEHFEILTDVNEFRQYVQRMTKVEAFRQPKSTAASLKVAV